MRIKKISQLLSEKKLDAYLVVNPVDICYLTGIPSSDAWLLVFGEKAFYITDSRYTTEVKQVLGTSVVVKEFKESKAREVFSILKSKGVVRLGFDERYFSVAAFKEFKKACPKEIKVVPVNGVIDRHREVKDDQEIEMIRECLKVNRELYRYLQRQIKVGKTEREILFKAEQFVRSKNAGFSFDPIIASGPNSALPHARISDRVISANDILLIDIGVEINGYKSDLTRIFLSDKIAKLVMETYQVVAQAQQAAVACIQAGVSVADVDRAARKSLKNKKLDRFFTHTTGHGVGLDIHESPRLSWKSNEILKEGMVVTVEPGVYFPGKFGIRIEDMVLVKENGCEILSRGDEVEQPFCI